MKFFMSLKVERMETTISQSVVMTKKIFSHSNQRVTKEGIRSGRQPWLQLGKIETNHE